MIHTLCLYVFQKCRQLVVWSVTCHTTVHPVLLTRHYLRVAGITIALMSSSSSAVSQSVSSSFSCHLLAYKRAKAEARAPWYLMDPKSKSKKNCFGWNNFRRRREIRIYWVVLQNRRRESVTESDLHENFVALSWNREVPIKFWRSSAHLDSSHCETAVHLWKNWSDLQENFTAGPEIPNKLWKSSESGLSNRIRLGWGLRVDRSVLYFPPVR